MKDWTNLDSDNPVFHPISTQMMLINGEDSMQFYTNLHPFYCGIDLHARMLYVCILDERGEILVHKKIKDSPEQLLNLLAPYIGNIVVGAECMHCWYWLSDFCEHHNIEAKLH